MNIIYVSQFGIARGSGYGNIAQKLCDGLWAAGVKTLGLGFGYKGEEHDYPFAIVPTRPDQVPSMITSLIQGADVEFSVVVTAMDIPDQARIRKSFGADGPPIPQVAILPVESGPLCDTWAMHLMQMDKTLIMSEFGTAAAQEAGVDARYIPIGLNRHEWRRPEAEERRNIRKGLSIGEEDLFVLTVADNQERKNLTASLEIIARARDRLNGATLLYGLVTRPEAAVGYRLVDYAIELDVMRNLRIWKRGISQESLWGLYAAADAFLLTSKAEGLGMPVLEAMSVGVPVVGTDCAAIGDHLRDDRGYLVPAKYKFRDTWGNAWRYLIDVEAGAEILSAALLEPSEAIVEKAHEYVVDRSWDTAVGVLTEELSNVTRA